VNSPYIAGSFGQPFSGTVSIDPSGNFCGGGLSLAGAINGAFVDACGSPFLSVIDGNVTVAPFLYTSGSVVESLPFSMTLDIRAFNGPAFDYLFTGSGTATVAGHSVTQGSQTYFHLDSYTLNFANIPEPPTGAVVILALAAMAFARVLAAG
jgi:hypothetical protein